MPRIIYLLLFLGAFGVVASQFSIIPDGKHCEIMLDNELLVKEVHSDLDWDKTYSYETSDTTLEDGSRVYNVWSTDKRENFRMEIDQAPNGAQIEITTKTERHAYCPYSKPQRQLTINIPPQFLGKSCTYSGYVGDGRGVRKEEGMFDSEKALPKKQWRFFCLKTEKYELIFDCNPIGPGEFCGQYGAGVIRGTAIVEGDTKKGVSISFPNGIESFGGMTGAKLRIKLGNMSDYSKDHALMAYQYNNHLVHDYLFSFGSTVHGKKFTSADLQDFEAGKGYGWTKKNKLNIKSTHKGAYYSNVSGQNASFAIGKARSGLHLVTVGAGNPTGIANKFTVSVNGQTLFKDKSIAKGTVLTATLPIWVNNGKIDVEFSGAFILSSIADQFLLADAEDYSIRRGFWKTDGTEPSVLFRNEDYRPYAYDFKPAVMEMPLPEPGKETAAPLKKFSAPVYDFDYSSPENSWLYNLKLASAGNNVATMNELVSPEMMDKFMEEVIASKRSTIMLSGMLIRHVYTCDRERVFKYIKAFCESAHRHGLRVIEHHDVTLLWNTDAGFRRLAERIDEVNRSLDTQLPGHQLCLFNPKLMEKYTEYLTHIVEAGVDGLQLDEFGTYAHAGSCEHCRRAFHDDTGWYMPFDETSNWSNDYTNELTKVWIEWKLEKTFSIKGELLQKMRKINPNLITTNYGTLNNFISQNGLKVWNSNQMKGGQIANVMGHECLASNTISNARMFVPGQKLYNFFRYNNGIPIYSWLYTENWDCSYFGYAVCNMNAQLPIFYANGAKVRPEDASDFFAFDGSADNMNLRTASPVTKVALLFSGQSRNWDSDLPPANAILGTAQTLEEMHVPYQFIGEDTLTPSKLKPFDVLLIGTSSCLSDTQIQELKNFAARGGTVILEQGAGTCDERGNLRKSWPLKDVFGFAMARTPSQPQKIIGVSNAGKKTLFDEKITYIPQAFASSKARGTTSKISLVAEDGKSYRAFFDCAYGKGRFVYLPAAFSTRLYYRDLVRGYKCEYKHNAKIAEAFSLILSELLGDSANLVQTNAPEKIYTTLYKDESTLYLHVLNGLGTGIESGETMGGIPAKQAFPEVEQDISFTVACNGTKEVYAVSPDFDGRKKLEFTSNSQNSISFVLPKQLMKIYTVVKIK